MLSPGTKSIKAGKVDFCIIVSFKKRDEALQYNAKRWQIETLFRALKTSRFNLEDTHINHTERLEKLTMFEMIAFMWCYKIRDFIDVHIKVIKTKKHGKRAVSVFIHGLDYISKCLISRTNKYNISLIQFLSCA